MPQRKEWLGHPVGRDRAESIEAGNLNQHFITAQPPLAATLVASKTALAEWLKPANQRRPIHADPKAEKKDPLQEPRP